MRFQLVIPLPVELKIRRFPPDVKKASKKTLLLLAQDPKHPSLKTHKVRQAVSHFGGDVFEAYVTKKYRLTWEYGPDQGMITVRNIDNHDECLKKA